MKNDMNRMIEVELKFWGDDFKYGMKNVEMIKDEYVYYLNSVCPGGMLTEFFLNVNLHDGLIQSVDVYSDRIEILVIVGDNDRGYFDCAIVYEGSNILSPQINVLRSWILDRRTEILVDKFESEKPHLHKIGLTMGRFFAISFSSIAYRLQKIDCGRVFYFNGDPVRLHRSKEPDPL